MAQNEIFPVLLLRLLVYCSLGVDAFLRHQFLLTVICFGIPFAGPVGMWLAIIAGIAFLAQRYYIEGALSIGLVVFNVVGNKLVEKRFRK